MLQLQGILQVVILTNGPSIYHQLQGEIPHCPDEVWEEPDKFGRIVYFFFSPRGSFDSNLFCQLSNVAGTG